MKSLKSSVDRNIQVNLIYRGSRDGWTMSDFHSLCDDKGPIVVIVKVDNGRLCGGFASNWKNEGGWVKDPKAFLFSLDLLKSYQQSTQGE